MALLQRETIAGFVRRIHRRWRGHCDKTVVNLRAGFEILNALTVMGVVFLVHVLVRAKV